MIKEKSQLKAHFCALLIAFSFISPVKAHEHPVEDLLELPHPMRAVYQGDFKNRLTVSQQEKIDALRSEIQPRFLALTQEALPIQEKLKSSVQDHAQRQPINEADLRRLAEIRIRMTLVVSGAYERLKEILDSESWVELQRKLTQ